MPLPPLDLNQDLRNMTAEELISDFQQFFDFFMSINTAFRRLLLDCAHTDHTIEVGRIWLLKQYLICRESQSGRMTTEEIRRQIERSHRALGKCAQCSNLGDQRCGKCKQVHYCSKECQKAHWATHKQTCTRVSNQESTEIFGVL